MDFLSAQPPMIENEDAEAAEGMRAPVVAPPRINTAPHTNGQAGMAIKAGEDTVLEYLHRMQQMVHAVVPDVRAVRMFVVVRKQPTRPALTDSGGKDDDPDNPTRESLARAAASQGVSLIGSSQEYDDIWWSSADPCALLDTSGRNAAVNRGGKLRVYRRWGKFAPGASIAAHTGTTMAEEADMEAEQYALDMLAAPDGPDSAALPPPPRPAFFIIDNAVDSHLYNGNVDLQADGMYLAAMPCRSAKTGEVVGVVEVRVADSLLRSVARQPVLVMAMPCTAAMCCD